MDAIIKALLGGMIIGCAVTLLLWCNGRVAGISGIVGGVLRRSQSDNAWRWSFLGGLIFGGITLSIFYPQVFINTSGRNLWEVGLAGLLVGFGTLLGSGCTSGHGVCGISRFSIRSIVATVIFILSGVLMVNL